jgi:uncharacterized protein VirK/YbjX
MMRKIEVDRPIREFWLAPFRLIAASRILAFPLRLRRLWSLNFMRCYFLDGNKENTFFFITHKGYLSKAFTFTVRVDCAITHYSFERHNSGPVYHHAVYRSPGGLMLWHRVIDGTRYTITLRATEDNRYEGDLSVLCFVDDARVCRISFSYVNGGMFGIQAGPTIFVTRSQTDRNPELRRFRESFKQHSPSYFCLASVCGIAMANGMRAIFMVRDDAQIAYEERYAKGFRNSYSALWEAFGAHETGDRRVYTMSIPPKLNPLSIVKHKNRAIARRQKWSEIVLNARTAILVNRTSSAPPPIEEAALELLPALPR